MVGSAAEDGEAEEARLNAHLSSDGAAGRRGPWWEGIGEGLVALLRGRAARARTRPWRRLPREAAAQCEALCAKSLRLATPAAFGSTTPRGLDAAALLVRGSGARGDAFA